jgi:hypothetical protein
MSHSGGAIVKIRKKVILSSGTEKDEPGGAECELCYARQVQ